MRRMCFDLESNYFRDPLPKGVVDPRPDPADRRAEIAAFAKSTPLEFRCGVVYDESRNTYEQFSKEQIGDMVALLSDADELISHSGRRHDIPILEYVTGTAHLRKIPHWDLYDCVGWASLKMMELLFLEESFSVAYVARVSAMNKRGIKLKAAERLMAKAHYDVERTYAVWKKGIIVGQRPEPPQSDLG